MAQNANRISFFLFPERNGTRSQAVGVEATVATPDRPMALMLKSRYPQKKFQSGGSRRKTHHYTRYLYEYDVKKKYIPPNARSTIGVINPEERLDPGPVPPDACDSEYFTISPIPIIYTQAEYIPPSPLGETLGDAMERVSQYPGLTELKVMVYQLNGKMFVHIQRSTTLHSVSGAGTDELNQAHEDIGRTYLLKNWLAVYPGMKECPTSGRAVWWRSITDLIECANDRAFHAVQRQLRLAGIANVPVPWRKIKIPEDLILVFAPVVPMKCPPDEQDGWTCLCEEVFSTSHTPLKMPCCGKLMGQECTNKWFMSGERQGNRTCPFCRGEVVPKDAFSEGALSDESIPYWERMEISVSQLDRRYDLLDGKIPVVYEHLLSNLLWMIRLERNRTNQPRRFNAGFYEETTIMYNVFDNFCASKKSVEEDLKELYAELNTKVEAAFMVSGKSGPVLIVSNGFNSFRIRTIQRAIKWLKVPQWNGQEFLQLEHLV